jgi:uncharacterized protein YndB with AHSA1/START domain
MKTNTVARAVADLSAGSIVATVWVDVPPERVYRALTSAEVTRWWGNERYQTTSWTADLVVNGGWRAQGKRADGGEFSVSGEFLEIDPPRFLRMTWDCDWADVPATVVSYKLDPIDGGTKLTVNHTGFGPHEAACTDHTAGWETVLALLAGYVSGHQSSLN